MKKTIKKVFIISFLLILLMYIVNITNLPDSIILFQGEKYNVRTVLGLNIETLQASAHLEDGIQTVGRLDYKLNLFGSIPLKNISVNVIPKTSVVPLGNAIGLKLYTNGVLVVGMSEIEGKKPYENSGIEEGDMIVNIGEKAITCTADLVETVNNSKGKQLQIEYVREGEKKQTSMIPVETAQKEYKLGLWVRDAAAGVGTVSFYDPQTKSFAALGHGILDIDTNQLLEIAKGDFVTTKIMSITKGTKGNPGKIQGSIENQMNIGQIDKNTEFGIYGKLNNTTVLNINIQDAMEVATRDEIQTGPAKIICTLENNQKKEYSVEVEKIYKNNNQNNKSMLIKVTDKELIEKTGGIIQGMSGSPIIQNGKVIGALTHVLVNNPEMGYGVFADLMIKQMREVE